MLSQSLYTNHKSSLYLSMDYLRFFPLNRTNRGYDNLPKSFSLGGRQYAYISSQNVKSNKRSELGHCYDVDKKELKEKIKNYKFGDPNISYMLDEASVFELCECKSISGENKKKDTASDEDKENKKGTKNKKIGRSNISLLISLAELHYLYENKELKKVLLNDDIDFFGRMYADNKDFDVRGVAQIAPIYSIFPTEITNDLVACRNSLRDIKGCIGLQEQGLVAFTGYGHDNFNISELLERGYTKEQVVKTSVEYVLHTYFLPFTSGVTGTAHNTRPYYFHITLRYGMPINHVEKFQLSGESFFTDEESIKILKDSIDKCNEVYRGFNERLHISSDIKSFPFTPLDIDTLENSLKEVLDGI